MRVKVIIGLLAATEDGVSRLKLSALRNKSQPSSGTILMTLWTLGTFYFTNYLLVSIVNFFWSYKKRSLPGFAGV